MNDQIDHESNGCGRMRPFVMLFDAVMLSLVDYSSPGSHLHLSKQTKPEQNNTQMVNKRNGNMRVRFKIVDVHHKR